MDEARVSARQRLTAGAVIIAAGFILSKLAGLVRTALLLARFGAGDTTDVFLAAFKLPDLFFNILVLGALSAAFVPVFLDQWRRGEGSAEAWRTARATLTVLLVVVSGLCLVAAVAAPWLMPVIAPGFEGAKLTDTIGLTRIMLLATVAFTASNVLGGILTAFRKFAPYALAPVLYNVGIIVGIVALEPLFGLAGLAWGVVLGALLHLLVQVPEVRRAGFAFRWTWSLQAPGVRRILRLMGPRAVGLAVAQVEQVLTLAIASTLAVGSVTVLAAATDLQSVAINVFGVSLAVSVFPLFSQAFADKDHGTFVAVFSRSVRRLIVLLVPVAVVLILLRAQLVRVLFGFGNFDWEDTILIAQALGILALALPAQGLTPVFARAFYALQDTRTPVGVAGVSVAVNIGLALLLRQQLGILGLAAAFTLANLLQPLLLYVLLRRRVGDLAEGALLATIGRVVVAAAGAGAATWIALRLVVGGVDQSTRLGLMLQGGVAGLAGLGVYVLAVLVLAPHEVGQLRRWLGRVLRRGWLRGVS